MSRPSNREILDKRDEAIRAEVDRLKRQRLKGIIKRGSISSIMATIYEELAQRYELGIDYIKQICYDPNLRNRYYEKRRAGK